MTQSAVAFSENPSAHEAGLQIGIKIKEAFGKHRPSVVILFAASTYDYQSLLRSVNESCNPELLVGSSSAGEFTNAGFATEAVSAVAIYSTEMKFSGGMGIGIRGKRQKAAEDLYTSLSGVGKYQYKYHTALIMADALSGHTDEIIDILTEKTLGAYQFFGGGAGDNGNFVKTFVFLGEEAVTDAAVILEILSNKPVGIGVKHGWKPSGKKMRVTASEGMRLISLNAMPAVEAFEEYAEATGQHFDKKNPIPFFLHNIIGIELESGYKLRVPLAVNKDGSLVCASDIPTGASISIMQIAKEDATAAAFSATVTALQQLNENKPSVALFFDCVATRLRMGDEFGIELNKVKETLQHTKYVGCNTYGQVARVDGQFSGFHNCTAIVCVIPE